MRQMLGKSSLPPPKSGAPIIADVDGDRGRKTAEGKKVGGVKKNSKLLEKKSEVPSVFFEVLLLFVKVEEDQIFFSCAPSPLPPTNFARLALVKRGASDRKKGGGG